MCFPGSDKIHACTKNNIGCKFLQVESSCYRIMLAAPATETRSHNDFIKQKHSKKKQKVKLKQTKKQKNAAVRVCRFFSLLFSALFSHVFRFIFAFFSLFSLERTANIADG